LLLLREDSTLLLLREDLNERRETGKPFRLDEADDANVRDYADMNNSAAAK